MHEQQGKAVISSFGIFLTTDDDYVGRNMLCILKT
jgi:hypothetical protein